MSNFNFLKTSLVTVIAVASIISFSSCGLANTSSSSSGGGTPVTTSTETTAPIDELPKGTKEVSGTVKEIDDTSITITASNGTEYSFATFTATNDSDIEIGDTVKITYNETNDMVAESVNLTKKAE